MSVCTFGIEYKPMQVRVLANLFDRIGVCFDNEPFAQEKADALIADLIFRGKEAFKINIQGDPGDLPQYEADQIIKNL